MTEDYGKRVGNALRAVRQMHGDTSKLLKDCDGTIGKGQVSIFGNYATMDLSYHVDARQWMAEGVYRYYDATAEQPGLVEGVMACFIDRASPNSFDEPTLIIGQIKYRLTEGQLVKDVCKPWDLWYLFFKGTPERSYGAVVVPSVLADRPIERVRIVAVPLYSVNSMAIVEGLMEKVRQFPAKAD